LRLKNIEIGKNIDIRCSCTHSLANKQQIYFKY
jgi:hypothetical protein